LVHRQDNARDHMATTQHIDQLVISSTRKSLNKGFIRANCLTFPCTIGHGGIGRKIREGDGIKPAGHWKMAFFLFRPDKICQPRSFLPGFAIKQQDSWCDLVTSKCYNLPLATTLPGSSEALWRSDNLYDIVIPLDHNTRPTIRGRGSAIFIHLGSPQSRFTQGCIALDQSNLLNILGKCSPQTTVLIKP